MFGNTARGCCRHVFLVTLITIASVSYLGSLVVRAVHQHRTGVGSIPAGGPYIAYKNYTIYQSLCIFVISDLDQHRQPQILLEGCVETCSV